MKPQLSRFGIAIIIVLVLLSALAACVASPQMYQAQQAESRGMTPTGTTNLKGNLFVAGTTTLSDTLTVGDVTINGTCIGCGSGSTVNSLDDIPDLTATGPVTMTQLVVISNTLTGPNAAIAGGISNTIPITGSYAFIGGGSGNYTADEYSAIVGGLNNRIEPSIPDTASFIGGGENNVITGTISAHATISGGLRNTASGYAVTVAGGFNNTASGTYANVAGGNNNTASGQSANVAGGNANTASGYTANVAGGFNNTASGEYANVAGGGSNTASGWNANVAGGGSNAASGSNATVAGGYGNTAASMYSGVASGANNIAGRLELTYTGYVSATNTFSVTVVPYWDEAGEQVSLTTDGARYTVASTGEGTIVLSEDVGAEPSGGTLYWFAPYANVAGGYNNTASGTYANVAGGGDNTASGAIATVSGGFGALASLYGQNSYAAGYFDAQGDAQHSEFVLRRYIQTHTADEWYSLFLDGASITMTLPISGTAWTADVLLVGVTAGAAESWSYDLVCHAYNSGTLTVDDSGLYAHESDAAYDARCYADGDALAIQVQRATGGTDYGVRWVATVDAVQVSFPGVQ